MRTWKEIEGYEDLYLVSSDGNVFSKRLGSEMKQKTSKCGYKEITLTDKEGKKKSVLVHRIVALSFIPNPNNYPQVNHKDENKQNNNAENLEWCTQKYNSNYGEMSKKRKHKVIQYGMDGVAIKVWDSAKQAAEELGLKYQGISRCCIGKRKHCGGYTWTFGNVEDVIKYQKDFVS